MPLVRPAGQMFPPAKYDRKIEKSKIDMSIVPFGDKHL
jgi:hypothetical protein